MKRIVIFHNIKAYEMDMTLDEYNAGDFDECEIIREYDTSTSRSKKKSRKKTYSDKKVNEYDSDEL